MDWVKLLVHSVGAAIVVVPFCLFVRESEALRRERETRRQRCRTLLQSNALTAEERSWVEERLAAVPED